MSENYHILITGANRGLGLEFAKQYAQDGWQVIACCRAPQHATALQALAKAHSNIQVFALDVADFAQIDALAQQLKDSKIDVLINNAGIYPDSSTDLVNTDDWLDAFTVNSISPYKIANAFKPHIAKSNLKKMATLTSKMGSIDDNSSGGSYIYRSSKAAANMVMKSLSIDLQPLGISVVTLHPGWVQTDMGGDNALINAKTSVTGMRRVIDHLNLATTGRFIAYDGQLIPW